MLYTLNSKDDECFSLIRISFIRELDFGPLSLVSEASTATIPSAIKLGGMRLCRLCIQPSSLSIGIGLDLEALPLQSAKRNDCVESFVSFPHTFETKLVSSNALNLQLIRGQ